MSNDTQADWGSFGVYMLSYSVLYVVALIWYVCSVMFSTSWNRHIVMFLVTLTTLLAFPVLYLVTITNIMYSQFTATIVLHAIATAIVSLLFLYYLVTSIIMSMATGSWKCFVPACRRLMVYRCGSNVSHTIMCGVPAVVAVVVVDNAHWLQDGHNTRIGTGHLVHAPENFVVTKPWGVVHYTRFAISPLDNKPVEQSHRGIVMYKADRTMKMSDFRMAQRNSSGYVELHME